MADQIYEIAALKTRVLELLRRHDSYMPAGSVAIQLGVPLYAVQIALEAAYDAGEALHAAGAGWKAIQPENRALLARVRELEREAEGQGAMNFGGDGT